MYKQIQTVNENSSKRTKIITIICVMCSILIAVYLFGILELGEQKKYQELKSVQEKMIPVPDSLAHLYQEEFRMWPDTVIVHGGQDGDELPPPMEEELEMPAEGQAQVSDETDFYAQVDFWFDKLLKLIGALSPMVIAYLSYRKDMKMK